MELIVADDILAMVFVHKLIMQAEPQSLEAQVENRIKCEIR